MTFPGPFCRVVFFFLLSLGAIFLVFFFFFLVCFFLPLHDCWSLFSDHEVLVDFDDGLMRRHRFGCGAELKLIFYHPAEDLKKRNKTYCDNNINNNNLATILRSSAGFTRREIMERCVDTFTEYVQEGRMEGPERNRTRHHCLGTLLKPLGYLSSGARVREHCKHSNGNS